MEDECVKDVKRMFEDNERMEKSNATRGLQEWHTYAES